MKTQLMSKWMLGLGLAAWMSVGATTAHATFDLQITEIWAGGLDGTEATPDWIELTNFGDTAATGLDGNLYYDDSSNLPTVNDALTGIDTIAPSESVIYLIDPEEDFLTLGNAITAFINMWGLPNGDLTGVQIGGIIGGAGLGKHTGGSAEFGGSLLRL